MRNLEQGPKPVPLADRQQSDFKSFLEGSLKGLVGIYQQLTFAIQSLHLIISKELLLKDKANTTPDIFQRCQQKIDDLKTNLEIGETEFEQLNEIFNVLAYYINVKPLFSIGIFIYI